MIKPITTLLLASALAAQAELELPSIIGDNMVLQQKQENPIWGWDTPGSEVTVTFASQTKTAKADDKGKWMVKLDPLPANATPATMSFKGSSFAEVKNVLVGEVWLCSGQSNMAFKVSGNWSADLEILTSQNDQIRFISIPNVGRANQYPDLMTLLITGWRKDWKQGDFPFYFVQLADHKAEKSEPGDSTWAALREAQTKTMNTLKNTGQAVIIDLGEANDVHPKRKIEVAGRLARWALAKDYGITSIPHHSPEYESLEIKGDKATVTFAHIGGGSGLRTVDVNELKGFAICGEDRKWVWADAKFAPGPVKNKVIVSSPKVAKPVALRYAWADNPVCNIVSQEGLPLTPFRTDDFPAVIMPK